MGARAWRFAAGLSAAVLAAGPGAPSPAVAATDPGRQSQWGLDVIGAPAAWSRGTGAGTVIAVVDSGIDFEHEDLRGKLVDPSLWRDFTGQGSVRDDCGHGTHVAGIAAARTGNGVGVAAVAPDARILPLKVLSRDEQGGCSGRDAAAAIRYAADRGATVINLSLGNDVQFLLGPSFSEALEYAWSKGSIPVVSAGNQYVSVLGSGYADDPALVVSATDAQDRKASYSSGVGSARWGLAAPGGEPGEGRGILSTYWQPGSRNRYAYLAGTSMAAPFVSGAAAVLRSMGLSPQQTVDTLLTTAKPLGSRQTFGAGRVDLAAAVAAVGRPAGPVTTASTASAAGGRPSGGGGGPTSGPRPPRGAPATPAPSDAGEPEGTGDPDPAPGAAAAGPAVDLDLGADPAPAVAAPQDGGSGPAGDGPPDRPWVPAGVAAGALAAVGALTGRAGRRGVVR